MRLFYFVSFVLFIPLHVYSGTFSEHKKIGDLAFLRGSTAVKENSAIYETLKKWGIVADKAKGFDDVNMLNLPPALNKVVKVNNETISYGELNGLAADHAATPLDLFWFLSTELSTLKEVLKYHRRVIEDGGKEADNMELNSIDGNYASLAINDLSHFYRYGESYIENINTDKIEEYISRMDDFLPDERYQIPLYTWLCDKNVNYGVLFGNILSKFSSIEKYIFLHMYACELANRAANNKDDDNKKKILMYGLYCNAYADHFIQDAFSSGHLVVNRSAFPLKSISNKDLHDFYGKLGLDVENLKGNKWREYGDAQMFVKDPRLLTNPQVANPPNSYDISVAACSESITEFWSYYIDATKSSPLNEYKKETSEGRLKFIFSTFKALQYIPIPFDTEKDEKIKLRKYCGLTDTASYGVDRVASHGMITNRIGLHITPYSSTMLSANYNSYRFGGLIELRGLGFFDNYYSRATSSELSLRIGSVRNYGEKNDNNQPYSFQMGFMYTYVPQVQSWLDWSGEIGYINTNSPSAYGTLSTRISFVNIIKPTASMGWHKWVPKLRVAYEWQSNFCPVLFLSGEWEGPLDMIINIFY